MFHLLENEILAKKNINAKCTCRSQRKHTFRCAFLMAHCGRRRFLSIMVIMQRKSHILLGNNRVHGLFWRCKLRLKLGHIFLNYVMFKDKFFVLSSLLSFCMNWMYVCIYFVFLFFIKTSSYGSRPSEKRKPDL